MLSFLIRRKSLVHAVIACLLIAAVPACQAGTIWHKTSAGERSDKHARKIEKRLAKFPAGAYLEYDFRDGSVNYGALGQLSEATFQYTDSDNNKIEARSYADVADVKKARQYIGEGSRPGHHVRLWIPLTVVAALAGGGVAAYEATR